MKKELEKERVKKRRVVLPRRYILTNIRCLSRMKTGIQWFDWNVTLPAGQLKVGSSSNAGLMMSTLSLETKSIFMFAIALRVTDVNFLGKLSPYFQIIILCVLKLNLLHKSGTGVVSLS